jgi:dienelactone hydrolase
VSIFYPIDKAEYDKHKFDESRTSPFHMNGEDDLKGIKKALIFSTPSSDPRNLAYRLHALNDEDLHEDFRSGGCLLTPVLLSHGYMSTRTTQAALIYHLVSYGCIVYALNHTDGTSAYFTNYQTDPPEDVYCVSPLNFIFKGSGRAKYFGLKITERLKDIEALIEYVKQEAAQHPIDLNKLVITGHSLGGITAIDAAYNFSDDIKLCISMDPAMGCRYQEILEAENYFIHQPVCIITTEVFSQDDILKTGTKQEDLVKEFYANTCTQKKRKKNYNIVLKEADHLNQIDAGMQLHEFFKGDKGTIYKDADVKEKYQQNTDIILAYLNEHNFLPKPFKKKIKNIAGIEILGHKSS